MSSNVAIYTQDIYDEDVDPNVWARVRNKLTINERRAYLFLRWAVIRGGYPGKDGTIDYDSIGVYLGGKDAQNLWEGGGAALSKAAVTRALQGLSDKGLISLDEGD